MELSGVCKYRTDHFLSLTRLTFTEADGTEYELHDLNTDGSKLPFYCDQLVTGMNSWAARTEWKLHPSRHGLCDYFV
jgi:hypothetical protein